MDFNLYELGLLYGDGHRFKKYGQMRFLFTSTHLEIFEKVVAAFERNQVTFQKIDRKHGEGKENWKPLHILETTDEAFLRYLEHGGFGADDQTHHIKKQPDFIRGYVETKGTLFEYDDKGRKRWRCSISGTKEDLEFLVDYLHPYIGEKRVFQRLERADKGIESESYRFSIDALEDLQAFLSYIKPGGEGEISASLMEKMNDFGIYRASQRRKIKPTYKHHKYATRAMAKELNLVVGGIKGGSKSGSGKKPVYIRSEETVITSANGWEGAYHLVSIIFEQVAGMTPPSIQDETIRREHNQ